MGNPVGQAKSQHALAVRHHGADSPQAQETARNLTEANAEAYIRELLRKAPALSDYQRKQAGRAPQTGPRSHQTSTHHRTQRPQ
jgi:hypothetical protein